MGAILKIHYYPHLARSRKGSGAPAGSARCRSVFEAVAKERLRFTSPAPSVASHEA